MGYEIPQSFSKQNCLILSKQNCLITFKIFCGSNAFEGYFDDAKESRVKQSFKQRFKNQVSRIKNEEESKSRFKIEDSRFKNKEKTQSR